MAETADKLIIGGREFTSRLMVGTGKYASFEQTARALEVSGAEIITVAVRRVNLDRSKESLLDYIDLKRYTLLPNTAGCYTADDAVRTCRLAREAGMSAGGLVGGNSIHDGHLIRRIAAKTTTNATQMFRARSWVCLRMCVSSGPRRNTHSSQNQTGGSSTHSPIRM